MRVNTCWQKGQDGFGGKKKQKLEKKEQRENKYEHNEYRWKLFL